MTQRSTHLAFDCNALFAKSRLYMCRGYRADQSGDFEEFQLWASLAIELLGKSTLSFHNPALVADPTHFESMFAACGTKPSIDVKTIAAETLFKRLSHLSKSFDTRTLQFCKTISSRRNSELHSGESPFSGMSKGKWENQFWHAVLTILQMQTKTLADWLDASQATKTASMLHDADIALGMAVLARVENRKKDFDEKFKNDPQAKQGEIEKSRLVHPTLLEKSLSDQMEAYDTETCPSCSANAVVGGILWEEEIVATDGEEGWNDAIEIVEMVYVAEEFWCPVCGLRLNGTKEIAGSSVTAEFRKQVERAMEFEPDYGND